MNWEFAASVYCSMSTVAIVVLGSNLERAHREIRALKKTLSQRCGHYRPELVDFGRLHRTQREATDPMIIPDSLTYEPKDRR